MCTVYISVCTCMYMCILRKCTYCVCETCMLVCVHTSQHLKGLFGSFLIGHSIHTHMHASSSLLGELVKAREELNEFLQQSVSEQHLLLREARLVVYSILTQQ